LDYTQFELRSRRPGMGELLNQFYVITYSESCPRSNAGYPASKMDRLVADLTTVGGKRRERSISRFTRRRLIIEIPIEQHDLVDNFSE